MTSSLEDKINEICEKIELIFQTDAVLDSPLLGLLAAVIVFLISILLYPFGVLPVFIVLFSSILFTWYSSSEKGMLMLLIGTIFSIVGIW